MYPRKCAPGGTRTHDKTRLEGGCSIHLSYGRTKIGRTGLEPAILSDPNRALYQAELPPDILETYPAMPQEPCGSPAVAVRAPDFALIDFALDAFPRTSRPHQFRNASTFVPANVIEFQDQRVLLAAIHARVRRQVLVHQNAVSFQVAPLVGPATRVVENAILPIVAATIVPLTWEEIRVWSTTGQRARREITLFFERMAARAQLPHANIITRM
jgi:hypothetical protein